MLTINTKMKKLAITIGDAGGIGPEVTLKALASGKIPNNCHVCVIGDRIVIEEALRLLRIPMSLRIVNSGNEPLFLSKQRSITLIDMGLLRKFDKKQISARNGLASAEYIKKAVELASKKQVDGIVTAPISKESWKISGFGWPGHTELLAELTRTKNYAMMLAGGPLRVILATIHVALKDVPRLITKTRVLKTIRLAKKACDMLSIKHPAILVAGLNPHAGESGMFGFEEMKTIIPAIRQAKNEGIPVTGPFPPDTVFNRAYKGKADIIICMYHDQGLIPLKMIAFDEGVNVTVGLPFIRTSPDHGTAFDIAWKGIANPSSMIEAIKMAARLRI
jgi:4-hydroxythreonine-4-phosphate dehydrogenase